MFLVEGKVKLGRLLSQQSQENWVGVQPPAQTPLRTCRKGGRRGEWRTCFPAEAQERPALSSCKTQTAGAPRRRTYSAGTAEPCHLPRPPRPAAPPSARAQLCRPERGKSRLVCTASNIPSRSRTSLYFLSSDPLIHDRERGGGGGSILCNASHNSQRLAKHGERQLGSISKQNRKFALGEETKNRSGQPD